MSVEMVNKEPEMLDIACMKVGRTKNDVKIMFDLERGFADYVNHNGIRFDFVPVMANEEVEFILDCFIELFGERFLNSNLFNDGSEFVLGRYAIDPENNVYLSMDWDMIAKAANPNEREKGSMDMLYFISFQKFSKIGSYISLLIDENQIKEKHGNNNTYLS